MKNQKGITLVALVITIIVLLILAGVSISLVIGNNGVLTQASNSVMTNKAAEAKQDLQMALASVETAYYTAWSSNSATKRYIAADTTANPAIEEGGVYKDATNGLVAQLTTAGYTNISVDFANIFSTATNSLGGTVVMTKGTDRFTFKNLKIDNDSGSFSYSPATSGANAKAVLEIVSGSKSAESFDL